MARFRFMPGAIFLLGIVLIVAVLVVNGVAGRHPDFSHGLKVGLGAVVIVGIVLVLIAGIVWMRALRRERSRSAV